MTNCRTALILFAELIWNIGFIPSAAVASGPQEPLTFPYHDQRKLAVAKTLTDWLTITLQEKRVVVALVSRQGSAEALKFDQTGMGHTGLAVYDPQVRTWIIYNLMNGRDGKASRASLWRTGPINFFYGQKGYQREALILIPSPETQQRLYEAILDGRYKKLFFTSQFNLLSAPGSNTSLNCTKWALLKVMAAKLDKYDPEELLVDIRQEYKPGNLTIGWMDRQIINHMFKIRKDELPKSGPVPVVTVESLYHSNLFVDKIFYSGRQSVE